MHKSVSTGESHFDGFIEEDANGCWLQSYLFSFYNQILSIFFLL